LKWTPLLRATYPAQFELVAVAEADWRAVAAAACAAIGSGAAIPTQIVINSFRRIRALSLRASPKRGRPP
jgi:hypothetical protein